MPSRSRPSADLPIRLGFIAAVLISLSVAQFSLATAEESPKPARTAARLAAGDRNFKIVCFGDSVTGIYYHTGGRRAYPEMLAVALGTIYKNVGPTIINAGVSGNTTLNGLRRIDKDVLSHKPQLVTVMFGLNDVTRVSPTDYAANLASIIDKCRGVGAEVMLCTPNGVENTPARPISKIVEYLAIMRRVAQEKHVPLADCWEAYEKIKTGPDKAKSALEFASLMSDEIHPNMLGHKLTAETIAHAITGQKVSLTDSPPPPGSLPRTKAALEGGKPLKVLAMPPFDKLIGPALAEINPKSQVTVDPWRTRDRTLAQIEEESKAVRAKKYDLVIIAVPVSATAASDGEFRRRYTWILNWSLSFGLQEWDCIPVPPSVYSPDLTPEEKSRDAAARKIIFAQDLTMLDRKPNDATPLPKLLTDFIRQQMVWEP